MDFSEYIGAVTAINMINNHRNNECYKGTNAGRVEEDSMTDRVKEVVYNPAGDHGKHNHTLGSFVILSDKWEVE